jgi:hypothetical protein
MVAQSIFVFTSFSSNGLCLVDWDTYGMYPSYFNYVMISDDISNKRCQGKELDVENTWKFASDSRPLTHLSDYRWEIQMIHRLQYQDIYVCFLSSVTEEMQTRLMLHKQKHKFFHGVNIVAGCLFYFLIFCLFFVLRNIPKLAYWSFQ